jgi:subtilisin family serine protease
VTYVSSVGNAAKKSYEAPFRPVIRNGSTVHDFDPGKKVVTAQTVTIPGWGEFIISFQWDEPFYSAGGAFGAQSDIDLHFYYRGQYLGSCDDNNHGGDAIEICGVTNEGPVGGSIQMVVELREGPSPGLIKFVNFGNATFSFATQSGTCFGHANAKGAIAIGAVDYRNTPRFGKPLVLEKFSSAGGVPIFFDTVGRRLATPEVRRVPWVVALDGVDTTFFGGKDTDRTGWPNFFGTSAAAPHVAGVAALMQEDSPVLTPAEIRKRMAETAIDFGPAGHDYLCGYGIIDAYSAVGYLPLGGDLTAGWMPGTPKQTCVTKAGSIICSKLTGTIKVVNVGNRTSNPIKIAFFLSADETPDASEQVSLKKLNKRLDRNKSANVTVTVDLKKLKGGASVAGQHLIAVIDPEHESFDPDDNNLIVGLIP